MAAKDYILADLHRAARALRAFADRNLFLWKERVDGLLIYTSLALAFVSVGMAALRGEFLDVVMQGPGLALVFVTLFLAARGAIIHSGRARYDLHIDCKQSGRLRDRIALRKGEEISETGSQALLYDRAACLALDGTSNPLKLKDEAYKLPEPVRTWQSKLLRRVPGLDRTTFNGAKVRSLTDLSEGVLRNGVPVHVQRTCYFNDRLTNNVVDYRITLEGREAVPLADWCLTPEGHLVTLEQSLMSDQLGGGSFLITADRQIVYMCQGAGAAENPHRVAPAGSGSFDFADVASVMKDGGSFQDLVRIGIFRELAEETGLKAEMDACLVVLLGIGRSLYRGGKPEAFGLVFTRETFNDLKVNPGEWDFMRRQILKCPINTAPGEPLTSAALIEALDALRALPDQTGMVASGPFVFNIDLARMWLDTKRAEFDARLAAYFAPGNRS